MVRLELTPEEVDVLQDILESRLTDMRKEISHTATREFREKLKKEEELVQRLLAEMLAPIKV